jgi:diacylglycerol kinase (ATP)
LRNQPKYKFFKNSTYAFHGLLDIIKSERSFQIELFLFFPLLATLFFIDGTTLEKLLLFLSLIAVLIAEAVNSAIERVVDLVTTDYHEMAKRAKDVGSTIVLLTIITSSTIWITILFL